MDSARAPIVLGLLGALALACGEAEHKPPANEPPAAPQKAEAPVEPARLVGSAACAECHAEVAERWRPSDHARAMQKASAETVLGDFAKAKVRAGRVTWHFESGDGFRARSEGAESGTYAVEYTIGVDPLQQYLVALPDGRLQPLRVAWDARPAGAGGHRWYALESGHIATGDPGHWKDPDLSWNAACADCHTTGYRKGFDVEKNRYDSSWAEAGVGCEACHGAGSRHVEWARAGATGADHGFSAQLARAAQPTGAAAQPSREVDVCAACHAQRAAISESSRPGDALLDGYEPALLDRGLYHDDGQVLEEAYEWGSYVQSRKYAAGVRCSDCHDPHSGRLRAEGNALCGTCHEPAKFDVPAHHHHTASSTPSCVDCHMSQQRFMSVDARRDHSFQVPRPDLTLAIGTPNACAACHAKRGDAWAAQAVESWRAGAPPRASFAAALHARQSGGSAAGGELAALIADAGAPAIARATALVELSGDPQRDQIERAARSAEPLLRLAAARSAEGLAEHERVLAIARLLEDPLRAVRIEAGSALASVAESELSELQRAARRRALDEYRAVLALTSDAPASHANLAVIAQQQDDLAAAEAAYRTALRLSDKFVPAYTGLADLYASQKRDGDAAALLHQGLERLPTSADLHFALGMLLGRLDQVKPALEELAAATRLAPDAPYFAYVQALALNEHGQAGQALTVLRAAAKRHPLDQNLLGATAVIARDTRHFDEALAAAKKLEELFPGRPEARTLVEEIENLRAGKAVAQPESATAAPEPATTEPATQ